VDRGFRAPEHLRVPQLDGLQVREEPRVLVGGQRPEQRVLLDGMRVCGFCPSDGAAG
jgi:hypothetical protein